MDKAATKYNAKHKDIVIGDEEDTEQQPPQQQEKGEVSPAQLRAAATLKEKVEALVKNVKEELPKKPKQDWLAFLEGKNNE
jgi:hypothetical protein